MADIIIYSAPIHTGKTSRLKEWLKHHKNVFGFLTPDVNGLRIIYNLTTQQSITWQVDATSENDIVEVGKYIFLSSGFEKAQNNLAEFKHQKEGVFVIDEIGKLELKGQGLEPTLSQCIAEFKNRKDKSTLIVIVRDYLLEEVKLRYELQDAQVVGHDYFDYR